MLSREAFEQLVAEALDDLPPFFQERIDNVEVVVRRQATASDRRRAGLPPGHLLLGLYDGVPLTARTGAYNLVPPDMITLYQRAIEHVAGSDPDAIREQVRRTVIHELAHHFGIDDDRLRELGAY